MGHHSEAKLCLTFSDGSAITGAALGEQCSQRGRGLFLISGVNAVAAS